MTTKKSFTITKFIRAKRERVFEAWINPELLKLWDCPEHCSPGAFTAHVTVGGSYRNSMIDHDETVTVYGTYLEIVPDRKLVFTSQWEMSSSPQTTVTVEFSDKDGGTLVTLTQEGFATDASTRGHEEGWASCLERLARQAPGALKDSVSPC